MAAQTVVNEDEKVQDWRKTRATNIFAQVGKGTVELAQQVADASFDLHVYERMVVVCGCDPQLAYDILS